MSQDGKYVAAGGDVAKVHIWEVASARQVALLKGHGGSIADITFAPDGQWVATAAIDGQARRWELGEGRKDHLKGNGAFFPVRLMCSPTGKRWDSRPPPRTWRSASRLFASGTSAAAVN